MTEVLFYHLQQTSLEQVLPSLLERSLERGWKAVVQVGNPERLDALNGALWTYGDDAFLPHGTEEDGPLDKQPVALTAASENPNGADVLFLVDGAVPAEIESYERCVLMFDGRDDVAVGAARGHWKSLSEGDHDVTYWQQNDAGGWEKKA